MDITEKSSFRDPAGQVFVENGTVYRRIGKTYLDSYATFVRSGLYLHLIDEGLLIPHQTTAQSSDEVTIKPEQIKFISYPYEWCFDTLKQAALTTLDINLIALQYNMILKDANAYNIQYHNGRWLLIDTLSFEPYKEGQLWYAYGQFLRHFYLPLVLAKYRNASLIKLLSLNIDGLPVREYATLLPMKTLLHPSILFHLHSHRIITKSKQEGTLNRGALIAITENLRHAIQSLHYKPKSVWTQYESETQYTAIKDIIITDILQKLPAGSLCDIGTNTGKYALTARELEHNVVAIDRDHDCIEQLAKRKGILPLVVDLCNPTTAIGWANEERQSFLSRAKFDTVLALALVHHVCIGNNIPLGNLATVIATMTRRTAVVEFVPLEDEKAQILAANRVFPQYDQTIFEAAFSKHFRIVARTPIENSLRTIYHLEKQ